MKRQRHQKGRQCGNMERERPLDSRISESNFLNPISRKNKTKTIHQLCSFLLKEKILPVEFQFNVF
jgi:hypothetical protein